MGTSYSPILVTSKIHCIIKMFKPTLAICLFLAVVEGSYYGYGGYGDYGGYGYGGYGGGYGGYGYGGYGGYGSYGGYSGGYGYPSYGYGYDYPSYGYGYSSSGYGYGHGGYGYKQKRSVGLGMGTLPAAMAMWDTATPQASSTTALRAMVSKERWIATMPPALTLLTTTSFTCMYFMK